MVAPLLVPVTPTLSASPDYDSGDAMGGLLSVTTPPLSAPRYLNFVSISSAVDLSVGIDLILFKSNPASSTFDDNDAMSIHADDDDKMLDVLQFVAADWYDAGTPELQSKRNLNIPWPATNRIHYAALRAAGTINIAAVDDLTVNFGFIND